MGALYDLVPFGLVFRGRTQIASGLASILNATTPLFTSLIAPFVTRDARIGGLHRARCRSASAASPSWWTGRDRGQPGLRGPVCLPGSRPFLCLRRRQWTAVATMGVAPLDAGAGAGQVTASALLILPIMLLATD